MYLSIVEQEFIKILQIEKIKRSHSRRYEEEKLAKMQGTASTVNPQNNPPFHPNILLEFIPVG